jgi:hypothetical protein
MRWIYGVACTSFNFCDALATFCFLFQSVEFVSKRSNAITANTQIYTIKFPIIKELIVINIRLQTTTNEFK